MRLFIVFILFIVTSPAFSVEQTPLEKVTEQVSQRYNLINHISARMLAERFLNSPETVILDIREKDEFQVSRIPGAIQVDPDIWTSTFLQKYGTSVKGKKVIFYCSVGVRSSKLATRVKDKLKAAGAKDVSNLKGGIFNWSLEGYKMHDNNGPTQKVHGYNRYWEGILNQSK